MTLVTIKNPIVSQCYEERFEVVEGRGDIECRCPNCGAKMKGGAE